MPNLNLTRSALTPLLVLGTALWSACGAQPSSTGPLSAAGAFSGSSGNAASITGGSTGAAASGASGVIGSGGTAGNGTGAVAGAISVAGASGTAGVNSSGGASTGGAVGVGGSSAGAAAGSVSGAGGMAGAGNTNNCNLPATVSFKNNVQAFLITSCAGTGCHVVDAASTVANGGFNHGYDWITAGAHVSSCPDGPKRFEVVLDVINRANPVSCTKSRKMPPPGATQPILTTCQIAVLQAWLGEPMVLQTHRVDDSSPTTPYLMPPFN